MKGNTDDDAERQPERATDWDGEDDPENPHNWPVPKKIYHSIIPTAFAFLCTFGSSVYTPGIEAVMSEFHVSREVSLLPFVFYLLGLACGPVMAAPMSETYGRKVVYLSAVPLSGLFTLGAGFSQNMVALTFCRFFAAVLSSPGLSIGTGTIADIWPPQKRGFPMALFMMSVQMGPALGPLIGGFVVERKGWRWTQWTILFALTAIILLTLSMSETYKKQILKQRAKKLGIKGPPEPKRSIAESARFFAEKTLKRPLHMLFTETIVTLFDIWVAVNFGLLNGFFAAFPWVFEKVYHFDVASVGLTFLGQAVGTTLASFTIICFDRYYYQPAAKRCKQVDRTAKLAPEHRLFIAMAGAPLVPIALFWFAWTARADVHWLSPVAAEAVFSYGNLLIFVCASLYLTDCYGALYGASAWSSNTLLRYFFAAALPSFIIQMYEGLGIGWATSLLAFISLFLTPIPFVFWRYGEHLRRNSKYNPGE